MEMVYLDRPTMEVLNETLTLVKALALQMDAVTGIIKCTDEQIKELLVLRGMP